MIAGRLRADGAGIDEAESLVTTVEAAVEGAVIHCLAARSTDPLDRTVQMLDQLIAHHPVMARGCSEFFSVAADYPVRE